jgi:uncharacterized protein YidB (DUF937 family)
MELIDAFLAKVEDSKFLRDPLAILVKSTIDVLTHEDLGSKGGLIGVRDAGERAGLGDISGSWVSADPNQPISPDQTAQLLGGQENLERLAVAIGGTPADTARDLADMLPRLVDELTPTGEIDTSCACHAPTGTSVYRGILAARLSRSQNPS